MIPLLSHSCAVRGTSREVSGGGPPALDTGCRHAPVRGSVGAEGLGLVVLSKWRVSLTPFRYGGSGTSLRLTRVLSQTGHVGFS